MLAGRRRLPSARLPIGALDVFEVFGPAGRSGEWREMKRSEDSEWGNGERNGPHLE